MKNSYLISLTSILAITSCATYVDGRTQKISLSVSPAEAASCALIGSEYNGQAEVPAGQAVEVEVKRSYEPLNISCTPVSGGAAGSAKVLSDVSDWGYGGAVLGVGFGAAYDTSTGAAFEYPAAITVTLGQTTLLGKTDFNSNKDFE